MKKRLASAEAQGAIPTPNDSTIASMVQSFEINREKLSKNRYLASVNVTFNERAVQNYVGRYMAIARAPVQSGASVDPNMPTVTNTQNPNNARPAYVSPYGQASGQVNSASANVSKVKIDIAGLRQWIGIKKTLQSMYAVQNLEVISLSSREAVVNLTYRDSMDNLQNDLIGRGMRIYSNNSESRNDVPYILVTRG